MTHRDAPCPGCGESMVEIDVRGVKLDRCPSCLSLWFDPGELADAMRCQVPPLQVQHASERPCPLCKRTMQLAKLGPAVVDWCEPCRGLFLDTGEFEIVRQGRAPLPSKEFDRWQKTKKGDLLEDLLELENGGLFSLFLPDDA